MKVKENMLIYIFSNNQQLVIYSIFHDGEFVSFLLIFFSSTLIAFRLLYMYYYIILILVRLSL